MNDGYSFDSVIGTFWIKPDVRDDGEPPRYWLEIDGTPLSTYAIAEFAAAAVHRHQTGWIPWDCLAKADSPSSLAGWQQHTC